jgi:hypothetical protein
MDNVQGESHKTAGNSRGKIRVAKTELHHAPPAIGSATSRCETKTPSPQQAEKIAAFIRTPVEWDDATGIRAVKAVAEARRAAVTAMMRTRADRQKSSSPIEREIRRKQQLDADSGSGTPASPTTMLMSTFATSADSTEMTASLASISPVAHSTGAGIGRSAGALSIQPQRTPTRTTTLYFDLPKEEFSIMGLMLNYSSDHAGKGKKDAVKALSPETLPQSLHEPTPLIKKNGALNREVLRGMSARVTAAIRAADYIEDMSFLRGSVTTAHVKQHVRALVQKHGRSTWIFVYADFDIYIKVCSIIETGEAIWAYLVPMLAPWHTSKHGVSAVLDKAHDLGLEHILTKEEWSTSAINHMVDVDGARYRNALRLLVQLTNAYGAQYIEEATELLEHEGEKRVSVDSMLGMLDRMYDNKTDYGKMVMDLWLVHAPLVLQHAGSMRQGDRALLLESTEAMLPLFADRGKSNYLKATTIFMDYLRSDRIPEQVRATAIYGLCRLLPTALGIDDVINPKDYDKLPCGVYEGSDERMERIVGVMSKMIRKAPRRESTRLESVVLNVRRVAQSHNATRATARLGHGTHSYHNLEVGVGMIRTHVRGDRLATSDPLGRKPLRIAATSFEPGGEAIMRVQQTKQRRKTFSRGKLYTRYPAVRPFRLFRKPRKPTITLRPTDPEAGSLVLGHYSHDVDSGITRNGKYYSRQKATARSVILTRISRGNPAFKQFRFEDAKGSLPAEFKRITTLVSELQSDIAYGSGWSWTKAARVEEAVRTVADTLPQLRRLVTVNDSLETDIPVKGITAINRRGGSEARTATHLRTRPTADSSSTTPSYPTAHTVDCHSTAVDVDAIQPDVLLTPHDEEYSIVVDNGTTRPEVILSLSDEEDSTSMDVDATQPEVLLTPHYEEYSIIMDDATQPEVILRRPDEEHSTAVDVGATQLDVLLTPHDEDYSIAMCASTTQPDIPRAEHGGEDSIAIDGGATQPEVILRRPDEEHSTAVDVGATQLGVLLTPHDEDYSIAMCASTTQPDIPRIEHGGEDSIAIDVGATQPEVRTTVSSDTHTTTAQADAHTHADCTAANTRPRSPNGDPPSPAPGTKKFDEIRVAKMQVPTRDEDVKCIFCTKTSLHDSGDTVWCGCGDEDCNHTYEWWTHSSCLRRAMLQQLGSIRLTVSGTRVEVAECGMDDTGTGQARYDTAPARDLGLPTREDLHSERTTIYCHCTACDVPVDFSALASYAFCKRRGCLAANIKFYHPECIGYDRRPETYYCGECEASGLCSQKAGRKTTHVDGMRLRSYCTAPRVTKNEWADAVSQSLGNILSEAGDGHVMHGVDVDMMGTWGMRSIRVGSRGPVSVSGTSPCAEGEIMAVREVIQLWEDGEDVAVRANDTDVLFILMLQYERFVRKNKREPPVTMLCFDTAGKVEVWWVNRLVENIRVHPDLAGRTSPTVDLVALAIHWGLCDFQLPPRYGGMKEGAYRTCQFGFPKLVDLLMSPEFGRQCPTLFNLCDDNVVVADEEAHKLLWILIHYKVTSGHEGGGERIGSISKAEVEECMASILQTPDIHPRRRMPCPHGLTAHLNRTLYVLRYWLTLELPRVGLSDGYYPPDPRERLSADNIAMVTGYSTGHVGGCTCRTPELTQPRGQ